MKLRRAIVGLAMAVWVAAAGCGEPGGQSVLDGGGVNLSEGERVIIDAWPEAREPVEADLLFSGDTAEVGSPVFQVEDLLPRQDGPVFVANAGTHEILALDEEGELRWRAGRQGEGPGEFSSLAGLQRWRGDTIVALDAARNVASLWTLSGEFVRSVTAGTVVSESAEDVLLSLGGSLIGMLRDGRMVIRGPQRAFGEGRPGIRRVRTALTVVDPDRNRSRVPAELPGPRVYELREPGPMPAVLAPMSGGTAVTVDPESSEIVWARADAYEVVELSPDGQARKVFRVEEPRETVTPSLRGAFLEQWSPWFEVEEEIPFPDKVPAFDRVFVATEGDIWARRFHWEEAGEEWVRLEGSARSADAVRYRFPPRVEILGATPEAAYAVRRDELDVEHIVRFRLADDRGE